MTPLIYFDDQLALCVFQLTEENVSLCERLQKDPHQDSLKQTTPAAMVLCNGMKEANS